MGPSYLPSPYPCPASRQITTTPANVVTKLDIWATQNKFCGEVSLAIVTKSQDPTDPDMITNYGCNRGETYMSPIVSVPGLCCASAGK